MKHNLIIGIVIIIVASALWFTVSDRGGELEVGQSDFDQVANIELKDYTGNRVSLSEFKGRPLVINSWAVWCPFCRKELPDFAALQKVFPDEIVVIAIDRAESLEKVQGFTNELGISDDMVFLLDKKDDFYKTIGGFSMPETVFIDGSGVIVFHKRGPMTLGEMKEQVEKFLIKQ